MDLQGFATYLISKISDASSSWESNLVMGANKTNEEIHKAIGICSALRSFMNDIPIHLSDFTQKQDEANNNIFSLPTASVVPPSSADVVVPPLPTPTGGEAA